MRYVSISVVTIMIVGNAEYKLDHVDRNTGQLYSLLCLLAIIRHNLCNRLHLNHAIYIVHVQMHSYAWYDCVSAIIFRGTQHTYYTQQRITLTSASVFDIYKSTTGPWQTSAVALYTQCMVAQPNTRTFSKNIYRIHSQ